MFKRLSHETQQFLVVLFSNALASQHEARSALPFGVEYERARKVATDNIAAIERHFAEIIGPDHQQPISEAEALLYHDADDPVLSQQDYLECARRANAYLGRPQVKHCGRRFTGRFTDIREMFTAIVDQTANSRLDEEARATHNANL